MNGRADAGAARPARLERSLWDPRFPLLSSADNHHYRRTTAEVLRRAHGALSEAAVDARIVTAYSGSEEVDTTTVTSKGQVTIPKDVRRRFGIRQGSRVEFSVVGDHVELRVVSRAAEAEPSGFGLLKSERRTVPADLDPASLIRR